VDGGWGAVLEPRGVPLEAFLRVAGNKRKAFVRWVKGEASWQEYSDALAADALRRASTS
jgi:hypothetical protein